MAKLIPNVQKKFERFPSDFKDTLPYWGFFSREDLEKNKGKLLLLDLDFERYCSLHCADCFRKDSEVDNARGVRDLSYDEILRVVDEARELGLRSVKICGVGEPTESPKFLQFVRDMTDRGIGTATFTKGQGLGSDEAATHFNKRYGIKSAQKLCEEFYKLKVTFMLGFHSFDSEVQDRVVGKPRHTEIKNRALENLINAGFTDSNPTRLAFCNAPIRKSTYPEAFPIYVWARERNIFPVTAVLMTSGKQIDRKFIDENDPTDEEKLRLWTEIYSWNIDHGLQTLAQIEKDGISCLPGAHTCNQLNAGLYVTMKGNVVGCPGYTSSQGNVREQNLKEIWENSHTRKIAFGRFNHGCPPKEGITIPVKLYEQVLSNLREKYKK